MMNKYTFNAKFTRRLPDPNSKERTRHVFMLAVEDMPSGLPKGANPREQNIDRGIWKDIKKHLLNEEGTPNTFHLKNKGISILAENLEKDENSEDIYITIDSEGQGIVDGAHTYDLILDTVPHIKELNSSDEHSINQYVKIEVLTGVENELVPEIAGGLNTAVQVQKMSLANLENQFDWLKETLEACGFEAHVAFQQNEQKNENMQYDVRDILRVLHLFLLDEYPQQGRLYPTKSYTSKEGVLTHYLKKNEKDDSKEPNKESYKKLEDILPDILRLMDTVDSQARDKYNDGVPGRKGGRLKFIEGPAAKHKEFQFKFIRKSGQYRLTAGALLPILGAFRAFLRENSTTKKYEWTCGFENVLDAWDNLAQELIEATQETSEELGRNPNAIGKSKKHWAYLYNIVRNYEQNNNQAS